MLYPRGIAGPAGSSSGRPMVGAVCSGEEVGGARLDTLMNSTSSSWGDQKTLGGTLKPSEGLYSAAFRGLTLCHPGSQAAPTRLAPPTPPPVASSATLLVLPGSGMGWELKTISQSLTAPRQELPANDYTRPTGCLSQLSGMFPDGSLFWPLFFSVNRERDGINVMGFSQQSASEQT